MPSVIFFPLRAASAPVRAQGERRDAAKDNPRIRDDIAFHDDHRSHAHKRKVERLPLFQLEIRAFGARSQRRYLHGHHHLSRAEDGLFEYILAGSDIELLDGNQLVSLGSGYLHPCIEGRKGRSHVGGTDHVTVLSAEDGVILILTRWGIAIVPSFAETVFKRLSPEVPAARPLAEVTPQGADVADLGNRHLPGSLGEKWVSADNERGGGDVTYGRGRTDLQRDSSPPGYNSAP